MLWDGATKTVVEKNSQEFERYMLRHHDSWYEYAKNKLGLSIKHEDIVLVRGFVKNSRWTIATFLRGRSHTQEVTVSGKLASIADIEISYSSREDIRYSPNSPRSGPPERIKAISDCPLTSKLSTLSLAEPSADEGKVFTVPKDQCLFLNYYKVKRRWYKVPKEIRAAGGSARRDDPRSGDEYCELQIVPETGSAYDDVCNII